MEQLNGLDSLFVYAEQPNLPMTISSVSIYDPTTAPQGEMKFNDILNAFEAGIPKSSVFRRRLVKVPGSLDHPYWIDDPDFDIEFHVRQIALPRPGTWRQFYNQLGRLQARVIDRSRPLWEAYVIEGLDHLDGVPEGSFALMLKVHHAALDGLSAVKMFMAMHDLEPKAPPRLLEVSEVQREAVPANSKLLWNTVRHYSSMVMQSGTIARHNVSAARKVWEGLRHGSIHNVSGKSYTRFNEPPSAGRVVGRLAMPLQDCQLLRRMAPGATHNDVMMTVISGALRRYLTAKDELPCDTLVAGCPVDVRNKETRDQEHNLVSMMNVALCTDIDNPLRRLKAIRAEAASAKEYHRRIGHETVGLTTSMLPPLLVGLGVKGIINFREHLPVIHNTMISNITGVPVPVYFAGARMIEGFGLGPVLPYCNLFHVIGSYCDTFTIGFNACREALPDPQFYTQCLEESWQELQACLELPQAKRLRRSKPPATKVRVEEVRKSA